MLLRGEWEVRDREIMREALKAEARSKLPSCRIMKHHDSLWQDL